MVFLVLTILRKRMKLYNPMQKLFEVIGDKTVAIAGAGKWGRLLEGTIRPASKHPILFSDPPLEQSDPTFHGVDIAEAAQRAKILLLAAPIHAIASILEKVRRQITEHHIIIDIASYKGPFSALLMEIAQETGASVNSAHPQANADLPSFRGVNALLCRVGPNPEPAQELAETLFGGALQMTTRNIQLESHDQRMIVDKAIPHLTGQATAATMAGILPRIGETMFTLRDSQSPHFDLHSKAFGRTIGQDPRLSADLITTACMSEEGRATLRGHVEAMAKILALAEADAQLPPEKRELPGHLERMHELLDPKGPWRKIVKRETDIILVRLGNLRRCALHLDAERDRLSLLEDILHVFTRHGIDMNAIDSLPSKAFPKGVDFDIGVKDGVSVDFEILTQELAALGVHLSVEALKP